MRNFVKFRFENIEVARPCRLYIKLVTRPLGLPMTENNFENIFVPPISVLRVCKIINSLK